MSWLIKALSVNTNISGRYFTSIDQETFYDWKFSRIIPAGVRFTKKLPSSDVITKNKVIAYADFDQNKIREINGFFELKEDVITNPVIVAGNSLSPQELYQKFLDLKTSFNKDLDGFKSSIISQQYFLSNEDNPVLYKVKEHNNDSVTLQSFGSFKEVLIKLKQAMAVIKHKSSSRIGRSFEKSDITKFQEYMTALSSITEFIDANKIEFLIKTSGISQEKSVSFSWKDLYLKSSLSASLKNATIEKFNQLSWVIHTNIYLNKRSSI